jgi:tRNA pseudouridine55 synthase
VDGILVLEKPAGPTSHDMVALVRRLSGTRRVGHGGTLDPFATGVLPIFLGRATRVVEYHLGATKRYRATVCFGASSTTDDLEGELTPSAGRAPDRGAVEAALVGLRGPILQRPPAYSALKVAGRRAYALARAGTPPELAPRSVTILDLTLVEWDGADPTRPVAVIDVTCSAGTYVRAIARDLGESVGSAAYLGGLVRTASGPFGLAQARSLETVREAAAAGPAGFAALLLPIDVGLDDFPVVQLTGAEEEAVIRGQFIRPGRPLPKTASADQPLRLVGEDGGLVAIGRLEGPRIAPEKVLRDVPAPRPPGTRPSPAAEPDIAEATPTPALTTPRVVTGLGELSEGDGPLFVVVGVFDGLHRGHLYLIEQLRAEAARRTARPAVITFDAHPEEILLGAAPPILCDPDERLVRLAAAGVQVTIVQHFDATLRMTPYDDFVAMITQRSSLVGFLMTPDAAFGHERRGTPDALTILGERNGFEVVVVPPMEVAGHQIRSSDIRALIAIGDLTGAASFLGRPFAVVGERSAAEQGSLAGPDRDILTFHLPVALPPPGRYEVSVEQAWQPATSDHAAIVDGPVVPAVAVIPEGAEWLELETDAPLPAGSRLRVSFGSTDPG